MEEIWKDIKEYEGLYQVSNLGRVKSFPRNGTQVNAIKILTLKLHHTGYYRVTLSKNNKRIDKLVHRLVAETFIPNPNRKPQVNHKDGDKLNNRVDNLEWNTCLENVQHSIYTGLRNDKGCNSKRARFKESDIRWIRQHYKPNDSKYGCTALSKKFKVGKATISDIINHKIYKNIGE